MTGTNTAITVLPSTIDHVADLCRLLNEIIAVGGTTAYQQALSQEEFAKSFLSNEAHISCFSAIGINDRVIGFQAMEHRDKLPQNWGDIATFAKIEAAERGIGSALFEATRRTAHAKKLMAINATIRADNRAGLAYYERVGFVTYKTDKSVPLSDGMLVDRISKRFDLEALT